jgi:para-nitrobenzyl esterase
MVRRISRLFLLPLVGLLCVPAFGQVLTARVTGGEVQGTAANGIAAFKGIPFAAPPVGRLRWQKPQPVVPWSGTRAATDYAPGCVQDPAMLKFIGAPPGVSEDCLYLNVWTPAKTARERLPVMVWIYGGGFAAGTTSSPVYAGDRLAEKGVVIVSVAYRVGPFGFLAHPELSRESGKGSGNYGLQDMIAGLTWVQNNIAAFGGDKNNVTVFGESAGGIAVSMLGVSPYAKGLFAKAISESGGSFAPPRSSAGGGGVPTLAAAEARGEQLFKDLGVANLAAARALTSEEIGKALPPGLGGGFWPVADGDVIPGDQYVLYSEGRFNDTPVLIGTNSDEGALFVRPGGTTPAAFEQQVRATYGDRADEILAAYPHSPEAEAAAAARNVARDSTFAWGTWAWARLQSEKGKGAAYIYYFDHRTPGSPNGANHASELQYVFRTLGTQAGAGEPRPEDKAMSELMSSYWVNFAKTGNPNGPGLPQWPAFTEKSQIAMVFDKSSGARPLPNMRELQAMDRYFAWRRAQMHAH